MNTVLDRAIDFLLALGALEALLARMTAVLLLAWLAHVAFRRINPRWRVLVWRLTLVVLLASPIAVLLLPARPLTVLPAAKDQPGLRTDASASTGGSSAGSDRSLHQTPSNSVARTPVTQPENPPTKSSSPEANVSRQAVAANGHAGSATTEPRAERSPLNAPSRTWLSWTSLAWMAWSLGCGVGLMAEIMGGWQLHKLRQRSQPVSTEIVTQCQNVAARLGYYATIDIRSTRSLRHRVWLG